MVFVPNIEILDEFLGLSKEATPSSTQDKEKFKTTQRRDHELWHEWDSKGRKPEHLKPLYESFKPLIHKEVNRWRGVEIPTSTIHAEFRKHFVSAVKSYDPKRGVQLNTWVTKNLQKGSRFIKKYQNLGKIPESNISKITDFKLGKEELANKIGYEPDTRTLADHLKWPHKLVVQIQKELRKDNPVSGFQHDPAELLTPKELEAVRMLQFDTRMSPEERSVYEYTFGMNGRPRMQPGQIAKQTGLHPSKISRIRGKIKGYLQEARDVL